MLPQQARQHALYGAQGGIAVTIGRHHDLPAAEDQNLFSQVGGAMRGGQQTRQLQTGRRVDVELFHTLMVFRSPTVTTPVPMLRPSVSTTYRLANVPCGVFAKSDCRTASCSPAPPTG